ncbi:MAG: FKBP-type peptidyl-prolyl cis-trans isomerase [Treponema sp.]|nr:FKBP-type peptidyl-prolyl cis-trans isomerase [Treponema sp.]
MRTYKTLVAGTVLFFAAVFFCAAEGIAEKAQRGNERAEMSYAFGMYLALDLMETGLEFDYAAFAQGFRETMEQEETLFSIEEAIDILNMAFDRLMAEEDELMRIEGEWQRQRGEAFLAENSQRPGVIVTPSGLQVEILIEGSGEIPGAADYVLVHYHGTFVDGEVFDTTRDDAEPILLPVDQVIPGWSEGLRMISEGSFARFFIPPDLAYGPWGLYGAIPPYAVLIFEVELIAIVRD